MRRHGAVLAVCGLAVETRIAEGSRVTTIAGGGHSDLLAAGIEDAIACGAIGIVSFGVAGALDPSLLPGQLVVADRVVGIDAEFIADTAWSRSLIEATGAIQGRIAARDTLAPTSTMKTALRAETRAIAVDMESHVVARLARQHSLPFVVFRAIADPAGRSLPQAAAVAMKAGGGIDLAAVLRSIAMAPGQIPPLIATARDMRAALSALRRGRGQLAAGLHYPDLG